MKKKIGLEQTRQQKRKRRVTPFEYNPVKFPIAPANRNIPPPPLLTARATALLSSLLDDDGARVVRVTIARCVGNNASSLNVTV